MVSRRQVIAGTLAAGAASLKTQRLRADAAPEISARVQDDSGKLDEILSHVRWLKPGPEPGAAAVDQIRQARRTYLKTAAKFPEYLDVGIDIWEGLIDWYVATRQLVDVGRLPDGRYFLRFVGTSIVLRSEVPEGYVGIGSESPSRL
jgi:hypothetical protein